MIKIFDPLELKDRSKKYIMALLFVSVLIASPLYGVISVLLAYYLADLFTKWRTAAGYIMLSAISAIISYNILGYMLPSLNDFLTLKYYLLALFPVRIMFIGISGIIYIFNGKLLNSTMGDIQLEESKKERMSHLKEGIFNYDYNGHMLTVGATGSAKTTFEKHIIKYGFENDLFMCIMSGKIDRSDKYGMLKYVKAMAKLYKRKLYVISMDKSMKNIYSYNPLYDVEWSELDNILANLITFTEPYYEDNFVMWICDIYDVILESGDKSKLSINNILKLYSYKKYKRYVDQLLEDGIINKEKHDEFLDEDVQEHEEIARKSKARLQRIFRNREKVFETGKKISITQARSENSIIYFDMNGASAKNTTKALGAMAMGELQHVFSNEPKDTQDERKLVIMDEISFYINDMTLPMFNLSRSAGYQCFMATQSFSDLCSSWLDNNLLNQMIANANQIGIMRQNTPDDADLAAKIADTVDVIELTKRAEGIDYDEKGSMKVVEQFIARPTLIKNLRMGEMVYISKEDDEGNIYHEAQTCMIHWDYRDVPTPKPVRKKNYGGTIPNPQRRPAKLKRTSLSGLA